MVPTNTEMATATRAITVRAIDALQVPGCSHSRAKSQYRLGMELRYTGLGDIENFRDILVTEGHLTDETFKEMQKSARAAAAESVTFADQSPEPPLEELHDYVYARPDS